MAFDFSHGRSVLLQGILDALDDRADVIASIERIPHVDYPVSGIALDMAPWHAGIGLALRLASEFEHNRRYNSAELAHFDLVSNTTFPGLQPAADFIDRALSSEGEEHSAWRQMAHLIFLAGAEALLDARVALRLRELGVEAPVYGDEFMERGFEYMVFDPDRVVRANYCELVLANRVTARWWPKRV